MTTIKKPHVALVFFSTIAENAKFAGNIEISLLAGQLDLANIKNEIIVLGMNPVDNDKNSRTIDSFIELLKNSNYTHIIMTAPWLPWLVEKIRNSTKCKVIILSEPASSDIPPHLLRNSHSNIHSATLSYLSIFNRNKKKVKHIYKKDVYNPKFSYKFIGTEHPPIQKMSFVSIGKCPYQHSITNNPIFSSTPLGPGDSTTGCSYCPGANGYRKISDKQKISELLTQIKTIQKKLPSIEEIAIAHPEDYLYELTHIVENHKSFKINPVCFSGQFRAGAIVENSSSLLRLISTALESGFRFSISVVGLESFNEKDLLLFNRDSPEKVKRCIEILHSFREIFPLELFMSETVGSFILFHPWQTIDGLEENVRSMFETQMDGIFKTLNFNNLRIIPSTPIHKLAASEGLLVKLPEGEICPVPLGGYYTENPWRFKSKDVERIWELFTLLQPIITDKIGLLNATIKTIKTSSGINPFNHSVISGIKKLSHTIHELAESAASRRKTIYIGCKCNQNCLNCIFNNRKMEVDVDKIKREFKSSSHVLIAGREPAMLKEIAELIKFIKNKGAKKISILTNGRILCYKNYAKILHMVGVSEFIIKIFSHKREVHNKITRTNNSFEESLQAIKNLKNQENATGKKDLISLLVPICRSNLNDIREIIKFARENEVKKIYLAFPASTLPFETVETIPQIISNIATEAKSCSIHLYTEPEFSFKTY